MSPLFTISIGFRYYLTADVDVYRNREPWYDTRLSYNPAIHRVKQALFHSAVVSDLSTHPIAPAHPELLKYFEPPRRVLKRARDAIEEATDKFKVKEGKHTHSHSPLYHFFPLTPSLNVSLFTVPKRVARARKDGHVHARDDEEEPLLLDKLAPPLTRHQTQTQSQSRIGGSTSEAGMSKVRETQPAKRQKTKAEESETEDEDEEMEVLLDRKGPAETNGARRKPLPTPARSTDGDGDEDVEMSQGGADPQRAPGRIVGRTYPLEDFKQNIARGDVVSKAVDDLGEVVLEVVGAPFAGRRRAEMMDCVREMREVCLKEDEVDAWNG